MAFKLIFWFSLILFLYGIAGFPLTLYIISALRRRRNGKKQVTCPEHQASEYKPRVSFVIAAYNEEESIRNKIENCFSQDYPPNKLEVIVGSDASEDDTDNILEDLKPLGLKLFRNRVRTGKIGILNKCIPEASGELIILTDANVFLKQDCVSRLVRHFSSPSIGAVCGNQLVEKNDNEASHGEDAYWEYDKLIKKWEMSLGSIVSTDGSIYALRKSLFAGIPEGVMDDLAISFEVIKRGGRIIYDETAIAVEKGVEKSSQEYQRRVRIVQMSLKGIWLYKYLLNPFRFGSYSFILFCHKVLRRLQPVFLLLFLMASFSMATHNVFHSFVVSIEILFLVIAVVGPSLHKHNVGSGFLLLPYYFLLGNFGTLVGLILFIIGRERTAWQPIRTS